MGTLENIIEIKIKLFFLLLLFVVTPVSAEWKVSDDSSLTTSYIDPESIERYGDIAKMPLLTDFKEEYSRLFPNHKWRSRLTMFEYNCVQNTFRPIKITNFSKNKGHGDIISSNNKLNIKWAPISDDENWERKQSIEIACKDIK